MAPKKTTPAKSESSQAQLEAEKKARLDIEAQLTESKAYQEVVVNQLNETQQDLETYYIKFKEAEYANEGLSNALNQAKYEATKLERKLEQHKEVIAEKKQQISEKNAKLHTMAKSIGALKAELADAKSAAENELKKHKDSADKASAIVKTLQKQLDAAKQELTETKLQAVSAKAELDGIKSVLSNNKSFVSKLASKVLSRKRAKGKSNNELEQDTKAIANSPLFDKAFYLSKNPDVAKNNMDPAQHYLKFGGFEGRNPSNGFHSLWYLEQNVDVKMTGVNPLLHYIKHGQFEGRAPKKPNLKK